MDKMVVLLVGPQGAGKTTYCRDHLPDAYRISQDEQGPRAHLHVYEEALQRGEPLIVVDRINGQKYQRTRYLSLARQWGYRTRIVWLNVDRTVCLKRCQQRDNHPTLAPHDAERALAIYFRSFQIPSRREADEVVILGPAPSFEPVLDLIPVIGDRRYLIIGDVHGCLDEFQQLLQQVHFDPANDVLVSVGDLVDRGPKVRETIAFVRSLPSFYMVLGNHEEKFLRYLQGRAVQVSGGLQGTLDSFDHAVPADLAPWLASLPLIIRVPAGYVVHAGFDPDFLPTEQSREDCLYMRFHGGKTYFDEINGRLWSTLWPADAPRVFHGHIPTEEKADVTHVVALDGGCVFGGDLRVYDSRAHEVFSVPAQRAYAVSQHPRTRKAAAPGDEIQRREEYVARGLLRSDRTDDGTLAIYTYTDACIYTNAWDDITRHARGHIYDLRTGECVARPFPKFFNLGENEETRPEKFPWDEPYEIMDKLDGWLGVLYRHEGRFKVASRGSFHSPGAQWASEAILHHDLDVLPSEVTLCFEIITPEQRIILDYGEERRLVILAAFNRHTGEEYSRRQVEEWGAQTGLPVVPLLGRLSFQDLLHAQKVRQNCEGFVIRFADGRRVKVKTEWYLELARELADLTPIRTWEAMVHGRVKESFLRELPEELRPLAERYRAVLEGQYARILLHLETTLGPLLQRFSEDRRGLALYLQEHEAELGYRRAAAFLLLDGKSDRLDRLVRDLIYPRGNRFVTDAELLLA